MDIKLNDLRKQEKWQLTVEWPELPKTPKLSVIAGYGCYSEPNDYINNFAAYEEYEYAIFVDKQLIHEHVVGYIEKKELWDEIKDSFNQMGVQLPEDNPLKQYLNL